MAGKIRSTFLCTFVHLHKLCCSPGARSSSTELAELAHVGDVSDVLKREFPAEVINLHMSKELPHIWQLGGQTDTVML